MSERVSQIPHDKGSSDPRKERLKAALKSNMAKRKAQARARDAAPEMPGPPKNKKQ